MRIFRALFLSAAALFLLSALALVGLTSGSPEPLAAAAAREDAYRANNLGVALLEQYKYREGAEAFTRALQLDPRLRLPRLNLSIALYNLPDLVASEREARSALAGAPDLPQPYYIIGLISKTQNRMDEALA